MRSLSRKKANLKSTLRNLATSFVLYERITTTTAKAKELKPIVEHLLNATRAGDVNARRRLKAYLFDENAVKKVIEVILPRIKNIPTGFIKSYKTKNRLGDNADMTILEFAKDKKIELIKDEEDKTVKKKDIDSKDDHAKEKSKSGSKTRTTVKKTK